MLKQIGGEQRNKTLQPEIDQKLEHQTRASNEQAIYNTFNGILLIFLSFLREIKLMVGEKIKWRMRRKSSREIDKCHPS
jgi:uncharacterized Tic20 family protein